MSGVVAVYERDGGSARERVISRMVGRLRARGPDRQSHLVDGPVALGHALLATTPEDAFDRQPLRSRTARAWIVADARIDNRTELHRALGDPGERLDEITDADLILRAYERWGERCAAKLFGDFAFAIWDGDRRRVFCARDHLGVRHLYYHSDARTFRCGTEMHALFADDRVIRRPHWPSMALFLVDEYSERDQTLYEHVNALPPAHSLSVDERSLRLERYWAPELRAGQRHSAAEHAARFREVFGEAVRCRLRSNQPVAAHVSGGLDSSSVACEAERLRRDGRTSGGPITLLRSGFPGLDCDELRYSQAVADHLGLRSEICFPLDHPALARVEQTYPDLYFHPTLNMVNPAVDAVRKRGTRVVLTGMGGDMLMQPLEFEAPYHLRRGRVRDALEAIELPTRPFHPRSWRALARSAVWAFAPRIAREIRRRRASLARTSWLSPRAREAVTTELARRGREAPDRLPGDLSELMDGVAALLPAARLDRLGALQGVEYRHPLYDARVVDLLLSVPAQHRFRTARPKGVLQDALGSALPTLIQGRTDKAEFTSYVRATTETHRAAHLALWRRSSLADDGLLDERALGTLVRSASDTASLGAILAPAALELWRHAPQSCTVQPSKNACEAP